MTVFRIDGFETYGNTGTSNADIETRIANTLWTAFNTSSGGFGGSKSLIAAETGFALKFPSLGTAQGEYITYEYPDGSYRHADLQLGTGSSAPVFCIGFRMYVPDITDDVSGEIWMPLVTSVSKQCELKMIDSSDIHFVDQDNIVHSAAGVLTKGEWFYIEVEYKQAKGSSGGYAKVYLDGSEIIDTGNVDIASASFYESWGCRFGIKGEDNQSDTSDHYAIDDIYLMHIDGVVNTGPLGPVKVVPLTMDADATPNQWSPSTGSDRYAMVNGDDWDTSTYVEGDGTDDDHYTTTALSGAASVHALQVTVVAEAVTSADNLHIGLDDGTADDQDLGSIATGTVEAYQQCHEVDPSGSAWTQTSVNSVESTQRVS